MLIRAASSELAIASPSVATLRKHGVDQLVEPRGFGIVLREPDGEIDHRVGRGLQKEELRRAGQQNFVERTGLGWHATLKEPGEHGIDLSAAAQRCPNDGPREGAISHRQVEHPSRAEGPPQDVVEGLLLRDDGGQHFDGRAAGGQPELRGLFARFPRPD